MRFKALAVIEVSSLLAGVIAGSVANLAPLVQAGSAIGLVGALAYAVFSFDVFRRLRADVS
mgnify:CR=1 FL=1